MTKLTKAERIARKWAREDRQAKMSEAERQEKRQKMADFVGARAAAAQRPRTRPLPEYREEV